RTMVPDHRAAMRESMAVRGKLAESSEVYEGDVVAAVRGEMAMSVADVMERRTGLAVSRCGGVEVAERVGRVMMLENGWSEEEMRGSVQAYLKESGERMKWREEESTAETQRPQR